MLKRIITSSDGSYLHTAIIDERGNVVCSEVVRDGVLIHKQYFMYDENDKVIYQKRVNDKGETKLEEKISYDNEGRKSNVTFTIHTNFGGVEKVNTHEYNYSYEDISEEEYEEFKNK